MCEGVCVWVGVRNEEQEISVHLAIEIAVATTE